VGQGSNLLVADAGFDGLAVVLGEGFADMDVQESRVRLGGALRLPVAARRLARLGLRGFEWAVGVPGSVGGAVRMNAGGHGSDLASCLLSATVVDLATGERRVLGRDRLAFGYRSSAIRPSDLVVEVELQLERGDAGAGLALIDEIVAWRRANQPGGPNAGSVFTNPPDDSAGRLIDAAGGRGRRVGTAEVSTKHANFIQADAGGRADDVWSLMHLVRRLVIDAGGPELHPETVLVGFPASFASPSAVAEAVRIQTDAARRQAAHARAGAAAGAADLAASRNIER
jgi:UDP-N-acetylmuramate dehydrogenase